VRRRLETLFGQMGDALRADTGQVAAEALVTELAHVGIAC